MSNREQVIRQGGQTWSTDFKARSLHQNHGTLYTIFVLYLRTQLTHVESIASYQTEKALPKPSHYIKIMILYIPYLSCIYGPNLHMSNREQNIRRRGRFQSQVITTKSWYFIYHIYPVFTDRYYYLLYIGHH